MQSQLPIYPEQASNFAPHVDSLMLFITAVCVFFTAAITTAIVVFFFKYHRKAPNAVGIPIHEDSRLEAVWMIVPLILSMAMFGWGAVVSAAFGIVIIGMLNFGVSFALALVVAMRARDVPRGERRMLPGAVLRRFAKKPFEFFYPPREASAPPPP